MILSADDLLEEVSRRPFLTTAVVLTEQVVDSQLFGALCDVSPPEETDRREQGLRLTMTK